MKHRLPVVLCLLVWAAMSAPALAEAPQPTPEPAAPLCTEATVADASLLPSTEAGPAVGVLDPLAEAFQAAWTCNTHSDCPCQPPACYCVTSRHICLCNLNLCCPDGECP